MSLQEEKGLLREGKRSVLSLNDVSLNDSPLTPHPTPEAELAYLRSEQSRIAAEFHNPNLTGWYYTDGALLGICDLLLEECLILKELHASLPPL